MRIIIIILLTMILYIYIKFNKYKYANEIVSNLWVGNRYSSLDENFLIKNNIRLIINCSKNLPFINLKNIKKYRLNVNDNLSVETHREILKRLPIIIKLINKYIGEGKGVLIHCYAGMQRAPTVAVCYLLNKLNMGLDKTIHFIKNKRKIVFFPGINYYNTMLEFYKSNN